MMPWQGNEEALFSTVFCAVFCVIRRKEFFFIFVVNLFLFPQSSVKISVTSIQFQHVLPGRAVETKNNFGRTLGR